MSGNPEIESFFHPPTFTWTHLVWDSTSNKAVIIDPVLDYDRASGATDTKSVSALIEFASARSLDVIMILETHAHADHITAAGWLRGQLGCPVAIGRGIRQVQAVFREVFNLGEDLVPDGSQFDRLLEDGETIPLGDLQLEVLHTPGHTNDSVTYVVGDAAFIGDTLFTPEFGTARCDFPGGDAALLYRSIQRIMALGDETRLFLCHDYPAEGEAPQSYTTVAAEKADNIHIGKGASEDDFVAMRKSRDAQLKMPALILPAIQVNIRAGDLPPPEDNGLSYLKMPLNAF